MSKRITSRQRTGWVLALTAACTMAAIAARGQAPPEAPSTTPSSSPPAVAEPAREKVESPAPPPPPSLGQQLRALLDAARNNQAIAEDEEDEDTRAPLSGPAPASGPNGSYTVPVRVPDINVDFTDGKISLVARDAPVKDIVAMLGQAMRLSIICSDEINKSVSLAIEGKTAEQMLTAITAVSGYTWRDRGGIIYVTSLSRQSSLSPELQGRIVRVIHLDYLAADDVNQVVTGMLSPVGQAIALASSDTDRRRTSESIMIEDLPEFVERIESYITQTDVPPRQVLIRAHILQVDLDDNNRHGVNLQHLFDMSSNSISLSTAGMASPMAPQAFFANIAGPDLTGLVEVLQVTTDAKTLASPSISVLNGQSANIQVGEQIGFAVTTTTETSTQQSVEFVNVGVILEVTPTITRDGLVMLNVKPEVSNGAINPDTGLPEEQTTELQTAIMLQSGHGIVIGGLIKEEDNETQSKLPWFGDIKHLGLMFQRNELRKKRSEVIVALTAHILPGSAELMAEHEVQRNRAETRLFDTNLQRIDRPWEPRLPHPIHNPQPLIWRRKGCGCVEDCFHASGEPIQHLNVPATSPHPSIVEPAEPLPIPAHEARWQRLPTVVPSPRMVTPRQTGGVQTTSPAYRSIISPPAIQSPAARPHTPSKPSTADAAARLLR